MCQLADGQRVGQDRLKRVKTGSRILGRKIDSLWKILSALEALAGLLVRPLGDFVFVGRTEALPIVEIMASTDYMSERQQRLTAAFAAALSIFHATEWSNAADAFEALLREFPDDGPLHFYIPRCRSYLSGTQPPVDAHVIWMDAK